MKIQKYNISKPKEYRDKSGEMKTQWNNIGTMTEFYKDDGTISRIMEIPAIGLEANIFPFVEKTDQKSYSPKQQEYSPRQSVQNNVQQDYDSNNISPEDIPF